MSKSITAVILLMLIFFADLLSIGQTLRFWQNDHITNDGVSFVFVLVAQITVAIALFACGAFIARKSFAGRS